MGVVPRALPTGQVTCCFTDIEGSTRLLQRIPDTYSEVLERHRSLIREAVDAHGGVEVKAEGDGLFIVFERPSDAVAACIEAQRALLTEEWGEAIAVRVRMGLHTGEVSVVADDYVGLAVHQAARVSAAAHGGQILTSDATRGAVSAFGTELRDLGPYRLKDFDEPQRLFQVAHPELPAEFPSLRAPSAVAHNLPRSRSRFVGRAIELLELEKLLDSSSVLTLAGPGGVGKTRIALELASRVAGGFADGVWLVELAPLSDGALVASAIASSIGAVEQPGRDILDSVERRLSNASALLVLDNCEHLVEEVADVVVRLLRSCPDLSFVATSQEPLHVTDEQVYRLRPLAVATTELEKATAEELLEVESVQLFVDRARRSDSRFEADELSIRAAARVAAVLDGVPLALELAAAVVGSIGLDQIEAGLQQRFDLLSGRRRGVDARHRSLRASVEWSYGLLTETEQQALRRLSVFAGAITFEGAADALRLDVAGARPLLHRLVDRSLLVLDESGDEQRLRMLESIKAFGIEHLQDAGELEEQRSRHAAWCGARWDAGAAGMTSSDQARWRRALDLDHDDLRVALDWCAAGGTDTERLDLARSLVGFAVDYWETTSQVAEGAERARAALEGAPGDPRARTRALLTEGRLAFVRSRLGEATDAFAAAQQLAEEEGALDLLARAEAGAGVAALMSGGSDEAIRLSEAALEHAQAAGDLVGMQRAANNLAIISLSLGRFDEAWPRQQRATELARRAGHVRAEVRSLLNAATIRINQGRYTEGFEAARAGLALCEDLGDEALRATLLTSMANGQSDTGDYEGARRTYLRALEVMRHLGLTGPEIDLLNNLANLLARQGDFLGARPLFEEALALARSTGLPRTLALVLANFADTLTHLGELGLAESMLRETATLAEQAGDEIRLVMVDINLGYVELARSNLPAAEACFRRAADQAHAKSAPRRALMALAGLGSAQLAGQAHEAVLTTVREGFPIARDTGDGVHAAPLASLAAAALAALGDETGAERLREAAEQAEEPGRGSDAAGSLTALFDALAKVALR